MLSPRPGPTGLLVALLASAFLSGCGSTVPASSSAPEFGDAPIGTGAGPTTDQQPGTLTGPSAAPSGTDLGTTAQTQSGPGGAGPGGIGGSTSGAGGQKLIGGKQSTVYIGYGSDDVAGFLKTAGVNVGSTGDIHAQVSAIAKDINRHGGLAGHPISLVEHQFKTAETLNDPNTAAQAACTDWTQDHHVSIVVMPDVLNDLMLKCLHDAHTPVINAGGFANLQLERFYKATYSAYPTFFNVGTMLGDTYDRIAIKRLVARKFFQPWDTVAGAPGTAPMKLGLLEPNSPGGETALRSIQAQLALYGIKPSVVIRHSTNFGQSNGESSNTVLQFRSAGVTHVIGDMGVILMSTAEGQHYRPRYLIPFFPSIFAANAPAGQLQGSMVEDHLPVVDTDAAHDPGDPSPASKYCKRVMAAAGLSYTDRTTLFTMEAECDALFFVKAAIDHVGDLSAQDLVTGFESLGSSARSAVSFNSFFSPSQHASATMLRDMSFQTPGCTCFYFTSKENYG